MNEKQVTEKTGDILNMNKDILENWKCHKCGSASHTSIHEGKFYCLRCRARYKITQNPKKAAKLTGRNDPCICGSGKKFKKCCGNCS